jgi:hypothetical protein
MQVTHEDILNSEGLMIMYAKRNCRHCYGRGYREHSIPGRTEIDPETMKERLRIDKVLCQCVLKKYDETEGDLGGG